MAAMLFMIAALAAAEAAVPNAGVAQPDNAALFEAAAGCAAYHIYMTATAAPGSAEAKQGEDKATIFLLATYAKMPDQKPDVAEARIEETVKGLYEDSETVEPEQHKREMVELKEACISFEPAASAIVDEAGLSSEPK